MKTEATTEIYIRSFEEMKPEYVETAHAYFVYVFGVWISFLVTLSIIAYIRIYLIRRSAKSQNLIMSVFPHPIKCFYKHKFLKWYWGTELNKWSLRILFLVGMYLFGQ